MFDDIGGKIKGLAKVLFGLEAIATVIAGFVFVDATDGLSLLYAIVGVLAAWVSAWFLYGFGQLIENSDIIAEECKRTNEKNEKDAGKQRAETASESVLNRFLQNEDSSRYAERKQTSTKENQNKNTPAESAQILDGEKICPKCGLVQRANRTVCWSCDQQFDN